MITNRALTSRVARPAFISLLDIGSPVALEISSRVEHRQSEESAHRRLSLHLELRTRGRPRLRPSSGRLSLHAFVSWLVECRELLLWLMGPCWGTHTLLHAPGCCQRGLSPFHHFSGHPAGQVRLSPSRASQPLESLASKSPEERAILRIPPPAGCP